MGDIDRIEAARGGRFEFQLDGQRIAVSSPDELTYQEVLQVLRDARAFSTEVRMPAWKRERARDAWAARYDLPPFGYAQRLCYLVDHYSAALTYDLHAHAGVDLVELWHKRRWRTLLDIIDRLPSHSSFAATIANDTEHAKMMAESFSDRPESEEPGGPSLLGWTPELDAITALREDVRILTWTLERVNSGKRKPPDPLPRPKSALQDALKAARYKARQARHESLVARVLPHKRKD